MNNGYMKTKPVWWEMRSSSICNAMQNVYIPDSVNALQEFEKFAHELPEGQRKNTETAVKQSLHMVTWVTVSFS